MPTFDEYTEGNFKTAEIRRPLIKRNVSIIASNWLMMGLGDGAVVSYLYLYAVQLGASPTQVGLIAAARAIASVSIKPLGGYLADKYGRKAVIVPATFATALAYLLFSFSRSWTHLAVLSAVQGLCWILDPAVMAIVSDSMPLEATGRYRSYCDAGWWVGAILGPSMGAWVVSRRGLVTGTRTLYVLAFTLFLAAAFIRLWLIETRKGPGGRFSASELLRDYAEVVPPLRRGGIGKVLLLRVLAWGTVMTVNPFLQIFAVKFVGLDAARWGLTSSAAMIVSLITTPFAGHLADRWGRGRALALGGSTRCLGYLMLLMASPSNQWLVPASIGLMNSFSPSPALFAMLGDVTPSEIRGRVEAIGSMAFSAFNALGSPLAGRAFGASPTVVWVSAAIGMGIVVIIASNRGRDRPKP